MTVPGSSSAGPLTPCAGPRLLPKAVVPFVGARDHYQLPIALHECGLLECLVTDLYLPADRRWFQRTAGKLLSPAVISRRFDPLLPSSRVRIAGKTVGPATLGVGVGKTRTRRRRDDALGARAARLAIERGAALFSYSYYAASAFEAAGDTVRERFLFQLHPHPASIRQLLTEELECVPHARESILSETEMALSADELASLSLESTLANGWTVASSFTAETLRASGISADRIHIVPYGVDHAAFPCRRERPVSNVLRVVFLGSLVQRKGLSYLLDAVRLLKSRQVELTLVGRGNIDRALLSHYQDLPVHIKLALTHRQLVSELHQSDLFVLPSLAEGFGHAILEAMSTGLPIVTTRNTCGPDVVHDGVQGFLVPIRDAPAIADRIEWGLNHREALAQMGMAAAVRSRHFTWDRFRQGARDAYARMFDQLESGIHQ